MKIIKLLLLISFLATAVIAQTPARIKLKGTFPVDDAGKPVSVFYGYVGDGGDTVYVPIKLGKDGTLFVSIDGVAGGTEGLEVKDSVMIAKLDSVLTIHTNVWDKMLSTIRTYNIAPVWNHATSPLSFEETNLDNDSTQTIIYKQTYPNGSVQIIVSANVTCKAFITNSPDASTTDPYDGYWIPYSTELLGNSAGITDTNKFILLNNLPCYAIMLKFWSTNATNSLEVIPINSY